jgi:flagellar hook-length control protein FliK
LRPQELGQIEIQLTRDTQGRISAHLTADRDSTHVALSQSLGQLRETLTQAGITVDRLQVRTPGGLLSGSGQQADGRRNQGRSQTTATNFLTTNQTEAGGTPRADEDKLLSIRA